MYPVLLQLQKNTQSTLGITTKNLSSTDKMCILGFMKILGYITDILFSSCTQDYVQTTTASQLCGSYFFCRKSVPTLNSIRILWKCELNFFA